MKKELLHLWRNANTATDYIIALWITVLAATFGVGAIAILYKLVTAPASFSI